MARNVFAYRTLEERREYGRRKKALQERWREDIFERDGFRCISCGSEDSLDLAHVTSVTAFVRATFVLEAMDYSYRDDNLVTLCRHCHDVQHGSRRDPDTRRALWRLERRLKKERGWSAVKDLARKSAIADLPPAEAEAMLWLREALARQKERRDARMEFERDRRNMVRFLHKASWEALVSAVEELEGSDEASRFVAWRSWD